MTRSLRIGWLACALLAISFQPAHASGPPGPDVSYKFKFCQAGPNQHQPCGSDSQCPNSKCGIEYMKGKGTTLKGTLTAIIDDDVHDICPISEYRDSSIYCAGAVEHLGRRAHAVLLEVRRKGTKYLLADIFQDTDPSKSAYGDNTWPIRIDEAGLAEPLGSQYACEYWIPRHRQPDLATAQRLKAIAGFSPDDDARPVYAFARDLTRTDGMPEVDTTMASTLRCKVTIRFLPLPLIPYGPAIP